LGKHQAKLTIVAYGDNRSNPTLHAAVAANFKRYSPDFILHMGDLVGDGRRYEMWGKEFFGPLANVLDEIPILPSLGNHEQDGSKYLFYMDLPDRGRWYSSEIGPVHMLALDFQFEKESDEQFAFAKKDLLSAKTPWKIVFLHYPVFNIGGHATGWGHSTYLPLFHQAKVDLVISGHSHIYERSMLIDGVYGARMTGGGFGGCTINFVDAEHAAEFQSRVSAEYETAIGLRPDIYICEASQGAELVETAAQNLTKVTR